MKGVSALAEVKYTGDLSVIDKFYNDLGVESEKGVLKFKEFEVFYCSEAKESFLISIDVDKTPSEIEEIVKFNNGKIIESNFDMSGPYLITLDPAGLCVRLGSTIEALLLKPK